MKRLKSLSLRSLAPWIVGAVVVVVGAGVLVSTSKSSITRARLERDLPQTFANRYLAQAKLLGHKGVTVRSVRPRAQCYKGVPNVSDQGSGAGVWLCYMSWHDPNVDETLMPGKFELNVHSNSCYSVTGPSKLLGLLTITDTAGKDVINPVAEFDGCFDPHGNNKPTGNTDLVPTVAAPTGPAALSIASTSLQPDARGTIRTALTCSPGQEGCGGTIAASLNNQPLAPTTYALAPGRNGIAEFQLTPEQAGAGGKLLLTLTPVIGSAAKPKLILVVEPAESESP